MTPADLQAALDRAERQALAWTATGGTGLPPLVADVRALVAEVRRLRAQLAEVEALRAEEQGRPWRVGDEDDGEP